jgi:hypothetical protein
MIGRSQHAVPSYFSVANPRHPGRDAGIQCHEWHLRFPVNSRFRENLEQIGTNPDRVFPMAR